MKTCTKCNTSKKISSFMRRSDRPPGQTYSWCRSCMEAVAKKWRKKYPRPGRERAALWVKEHPDRRKQYIKTWFRTRYQTDPNFRVLSCLRSRIASALNGSIKKSAATKTLLGCSVSSLWSHLESRFKPGMTRENYGRVWHVDHKKPCASFNLTDPEQQKICFHWSNLQPLFVLDNLSKGAKI